MTHFGRFVPAFLLLTAMALADEPRATTVGMPARIEQLLLPGSELEAVPLDDRRRPIVLRVEAAFRHGDSYRYDLAYYGLEPGEFDLRSYLRRKDGSPLGQLPPIPVRIASVLPAGQIEPHALGIGTLPWLGGYQLALIAGGVLWVGGLLAILLVERRRAAAQGAAERPASLADRLRPLVEQATAGKLAHDRLAELERLLLAWWRKRLKLETERPTVAIARLREHPEAGGLLTQLEVWLHQPASTAAVDVPSLLRPYQQLPADALEQATD